MEERKVQQVGGGTFTVSLPKEWARSQGVAPGTVVRLHSHVDGVLVLEADERSDDAPRTVRVDAADVGTDHLDRIVRAAYAAGADEVTLATDDAGTEARRSVATAGRRLAGVTVRDAPRDAAGGDDAEAADPAAGDDSGARGGPDASAAGAPDGGLAVRTLLDPEEVSLRQSVRQLSFVALSTHREATRALVGDGSDPGASTRDPQVDRLSALVERSFDRALTSLDEVDALGLDRPALFDLWATTRELERVADNGERIAGVAEAAAVPDRAAMDDLASAAETARGAVEDGVGIVLGDAAATAETVDGVFGARDRVRAATADVERRLFDGANGDASDAVDRRLVHAVDAVARTADAAAAVAEVGLRAAIRRDDLRVDGSDGGAAAGSDSDRDARVGNDRGRDGTRPADDPDRDATGDEDGRGRTGG